MKKYDFNKVARNFIEITFRHGCSPVNLLHIFRTPFPKSTSGWLLLNVPDKSVGLRISLYEQIFPKENDKEMKFAKFQK